MEPIIRTIRATDWITIILVVSLAFALTAKTLFYQRFMSFIILPFNNKYITIYTKKDTLFNWFHILMSCFQVLNTALFIYLFWDIFITTEEKGKPFMFSIILTCVVLFQVVKLLLTLTNGFIFNSYKTFNEISFKKLSYLNYGGIILFLGNVILTYIAVSSKSIGILILIFFCALILIGWLTVARNYQKLITGYFFYFILYLCALEIGPLILMGSFLK